MSRDKGDAAFLLDMLTSAEAVVRYVAGKTHENYSQEEMLRDAVERRIEIIGEAARSVSKLFRDAHPEIPWKPIMATRHILAHDYDAVDDDIVWRVATIHVPELVRLLSSLIPPIPPDPEPD
jgi:uncharacterized protein with HEPN domain